MNKSNKTVTAAVKRRRKARRAQNSAERAEMQLARAAKKESAAYRRIRHDLDESETNQYLAALVEPEERGQGVVYPDTFSRRTAMVQTVSSFATPVTSVAIGDMPAGSFGLVVRPDMRDPVWALREQDGTDSVVTGLMRIGVQRDFSGIFPKEPTLVMDASKAMEISSTYSNIVAPIRWGDGAESWPVRGFGNSGSSDYVFFGIPGLNPTSSNITVHFNLAEPVTGSITLAARTVTTTMTGTPVTTVGTGSSTYTLTIGGTMVTDFGLPGVGVQVSAIGATAPIGLLSIEVSFAILGATSAETTVRFLKEPLPDENVYEQSVDRFRLVSASLLETFRGNALNSGGQIAGLMYDGGLPIAWNPYLSYSALSEVPGGFNGPLKTGLYSFWKPEDEKDMVFRPYPVISETSPMLLCFGTIDATDATNALVLRTRAVMNWEIESSAQFYGYRISRVSPQEIALASVYLSAIRTSMENPLHFKQIGDFLKKVGKGALEVGKAAAATAPLWMPLLV